jgi:hypothetical protein
MRWHSHHPKIVVRVTTEVGPAHGKVVITAHGRRIGHGRLHDGRVKIRVKRLAHGDHRLVARFRPTSSLKFSRAGAVRVVIKR